MRLFISFNKQDADTARRIRRALERHDGVAVMLSADGDAGPELGRTWQDWIWRTLRNSDVVVFLASNGSAESSWCTAELGVARVLNIPIVTYLVHDGASINPVAPSHQAHALPPLDEVLSQVSARLGPAFVSTGPATTDPYPGLRAFNEDEAEVHFGRSTEIEDLVEALERRPSGALVLHGPSGSGKSSLLRAGLIPRLRSTGWDVIGPVQPAELASRDLEEVDQPRAVVLVDQFEEILRLDEADRDRIVAWLGRAAAGPAGLVVATRIESRTSVNDYVPPGSADRYLPYLRRDQLAEVIEGPARAANLSISSKLVQALIDQTGSGEALPLLAFTLHDLWTARDMETEQLSIHRLHANGGVAGLMFEQAERALADCSGNKRDRETQVLEALSRLASPTDHPPTRAPKLARRFNSEEMGWLQHFQERGLVAFRTSFSIDDRLDSGSIPSGDDVIDVTHEALFRWEPLSAAIDSQRSSNLLRAQCELAAAEYETTGDVGLLLSGDRLTQAMRDGLASKPGLGHYVRSSRKADQNTKIRRRLSAVSLLLAVTAIGAAFYAFSQRDAAIEQERIGRSIRVAAQSNEAIKTERDLAMLGAVAAYRMDRNTDTEAAVRNTLSTPDGPVRFRWAETNEIFWPTIRVGPAGASSITTSARAVVVDVVSASIVVEPTGLAEVDANSALLTTDGEALIVAGRIPPVGFALGKFTLATQETEMIDLSDEVVSVLETPVGLVFGDSRGNVWHVTDFEDDPILIGAHERKVTGLSISADDLHLISASSSGSLLHARAGTVWATGNPLLHPNVPPTQTSKAVFSPVDPDLLFTAGPGAAVFRWRLSEDQSVAEVGRNAGGTSALGISADGAVLVTGTATGLVRRWNARAGGSAGSDIAVARSPIRRFDSVLGRTVWAMHDTGAVELDLGPTRLLTTDEVETVWAGESAQTLVVGDGPTAIVTTEAELVTSSGVRMQLPVNTRRAWWANDGSIVAEVGALDQVGVGPVDLVVVSPQGDPAPIALGATSVTVEGCTAAALFPDRVQLVDTGCGNPDRNIDLEAQFERVALSPSGESLALVKSGSLLVMEIATESASWSTEALTNEPATAMVMLDDDRVIIGRDRGGGHDAVERVNGDGAQFTRFTDHDDDVLWIASGGTGRIYTGGQDGLLVELDIAERRTVGQPLHGGFRIEQNDATAEIRGIQVDPSGTVLAVHGYAVVAWELDPEVLVERACESAGRTLTPSERRQLAIDDDLAVCEAVGPTD